MEYHIYRDMSGYWRWSLKSANNKIIADSGEGYNQEQDCRDGIALVKASAIAPVIKD